MVAESKLWQKKTVHLKAEGHEQDPSLDQDPEQDPGLAGGLEAGPTLAEETNPGPSQDPGPSPGQGPSQDPEQSPGQDLVQDPSLSQMSEMIGPGVIPRQEMGMDPMIQMMTNFYELIGKHHYNLILFLKSPL